jgi:hypothetical protein
LRVTDANLCFDDTQTVSITVNPNPTATIDSATPNPTTECRAVEFVGSLVNGTAPYVYEWDFDSDLVVDASGAPLTSPSYTYLAVGSPYTATLTVTDSVGCVSTTTFPGIVVNPNPVASVASATPNPACVGAGVQFDANPAGGTPPYGYEWDFNNDSVVDGTLKNPLYAYPVAGSYTALVNVTDAKGCVSGWTAVPNNQIVVNPPAVAYDASFDPVTTLAEDCGDGDAVVEPGERWSATVRLENTSATCNATSVLAALEVNAGSVVAATVCNNPGMYGDIPASGTATFTYSFLVDSGAVCINDITFDVTNILSSESTYPDELAAFAVQVGVMNAGATETGNQVTDPLNATSATAASDFAPAFTLASAQTATLSYSLAYTPPSVLETSTQFTDPITANNSTAQSVLMSPFTLDAPAISSTLSYTLTGTSDLVNCVRVELIDPFSTATILKDYGVADANPYDVTALYTDPGTYILSLTELTGCSPNPKDAELSGAQMDVTALGSETATSSVRIELVDPSLAVTPLKDYGVADASPYDVTALYTGPGTYQIQVSENAGGTATVTGGVLDVTEPDWIECDASACACPLPPPDEPSDELSPTPLRIISLNGNTVRVEEIADATEYVVYMNVLGSFQQPASDDKYDDGAPTLDGCNASWSAVGGGEVEFSLTFNPNSWMVVSARNASGESSVGRQNDGTERNTLGTWNYTGLACP